VKPGAKAPASIDPQLAAAIDQFFAHRVPSGAPPPSRKVAERAAAQDQQVQADLIVLRTLPPTTGAAAQP